MAAADKTARELLRSLPSLKGPFEPLDLTAFPATPHEAFTDWLHIAIAHGIKEPHAMTLSTVDEDGFPDARVLILKNLDYRGWHFAIKADSPKGKQIINNPAVALTFYWPQLGRQIRIRGNAIELAAAESAKDFMDRPLGSKVAAVASKQSEIMEHGSALHENLVKAKEMILQNPDFVAPAWKVYAVAPKTVEFWQGGTDRMHQRLRYENSGHNQWTRHVLYP